MKFYRRPWTRCQIIVGATVAAIGIFLVTFVPIYMKSLIYSEFVIDSPASSAYKDFLEQPQDVASVYNSYYVWNVTNHEAVTLNGSAPIVVEVGPYTYRQRITHPSEDLLWRADATLEYIEHCQYIFDPSRSNGAESDIVYTVNMGYVGALNKVRDNAILKFVVEEEIKLQNTQLFITLNVSQLIWGYENPLLAALNKLDNTINPIVALQVKDDTNQTILPAAIFTGGAAGDGLWQPARNDLRQMTQWNGMNRYLNYWNSSYANQINGTDGTNFHPYFGKGEEPSAFVDSLYRSVVLSGCGEDSVNGIRVYCVSLREDMLLSAAHNPDNAAFYMTHTGFLPLPPALGEPIYVSLPHFHRANWSEPKIGNVKFIPDDHDNIIYDTRLYVEPFTGQLFKANKRLQVNTLLEPGVTAPATAPATYMPIVWIDQHPELTSSTISKFKLIIYLPYYGSIVVGSVCIFLGLVLVVVAIVRCTCWVSKERKEDVYDGINYRPLMSDGPSGTRHENASMHTVSRGASRVN